jgi:hypothetical protein
MNENATQQSIAGYLWQVTTNYMGISPSPLLKEHGDHAAERIESLRSSFLTHLPAIGIGQTTCGDPRSSHIRDWNRGMSRDKS